MQHPRLILNQGILVRDRAFAGPWILEFYDQFEELQAVCFSDPECKGSNHIVFRSDKQFLDKLISRGYGRRFDLLRAPMPFTCPGRIRVRQGLDGKTLMETERAVSVKIYQADTLVAVFYRALSDDVWAGCNDTEADWKQTLSRVEALPHNVQGALA